MLNVNIKKEHIILGVLGFTAFVAYAFFPWATTRSEMVRFNSPDETVNYFFSKQISVASGPRYIEPLNLVASNIVRPRSTTVIGETVVPTSFLGLPIFYGGLGLLLGGWILPYLTAIITVLMLFAAYGIWKHFLKKRMALGATILLALHPALWYYASRGFYHNVLFLDLIIFACWGYLKMRDHKWSLEWFSFSVVMVMAAIFVRSSEILWLLPIIIYAGYKDWPHWTLRHLAVGLGIVGAIGSLVLLLWAEIYGSSVTGYPLAVSGATQSFFALGASILGNIFIPFGFHPWRVVSNTFFYGFILFLPFWLLVAVGFGKWKSSKGIFFNFQLPREYMLVGVWVTLWLLFYYGSWRIVDTVGPNQLTVGISYVRYWLPIYVIWLPLAVFGLDILSQKLKRGGREWIVFSFVILGLLSFGQVYFDRTEGLVNVAERLGEFRLVGQSVNQITGADAVIISDRSDKVFFPERRVISPGDRPFFTYQEVLEGLPRVADLVPVYIYNKSRLDKNIIELLQKQQHFVIKRPLALPDGGWLYPLVRL